MSHSHRRRLLRSIPTWILSAFLISVAPAASSGASPPPHVPISNPDTDTWILPKLVPPPARGPGEPTSPEGECDWNFSANVRAHPLETGQHLWPDIAVGPSGLVAAAWMDDHQTGGYHIFYAASTDGGVTWTAPEKIDTRTTGFYSKFVDMDFTPSGIPVVVWEDDRFGETSINVYLSKRDPAIGGNPWTANVQVNTAGSPPGNTDFMNPSLAVLDDQRYFVVWTDWREGVFHQVYSRATADGGVTWGLEKRVSDGLGYEPVAGDPCLVVDPTSAVSGQERLYCVTNDWRGDVPGGRYPNVYFYRSTDGGANWSIGVQVNDIEPLYQQTSSHALVRLESGTLTAGWLNDSGGGSQLRTCVSTNQGMTWGASVQVNPPIYGTGTYSSIAAWDEVLFAGFDLYQGDWNSHFRVSSDGGMTWVDESCRMDDDASGSAAGNTVIAPSSPVQVYGAWMDNRAPNFGPWKIYTSRGDRSSASVDPPAPVADFSRPVVVPAPNPSRLGSAVRMMIPSPSLPIGIGSLLRVYDARGSLLRTLPVGTEVTEVVWDGTDWRGLQAAAGVYWVRLQPDAGARGGAEFGVSGMHASVVRIR